MRLTKYLLGILIVFFASFLCPVQAADDVLLPLPFENLSGRSEYQWVGDSFAIIFTDLLDTPGLIVMTPDERLLTYERMGLKPNEVLTRATEIRVAEASAATLLLTGNYEINGEGAAATVAITAQLVNLREGRKKPLNFSGPLSDLQTMQGLLAWNILYDRDPALPYSQEQFKRRAKLIPSRAYEFLVKALQAPDLKSREIFLKRSIKEFNEAESVGHYAYALYEIGLVSYRQRNFAEAVRNFKELIKDDPHYLESQFFLTLALHFQGQNNEAAEVADRLAAALPMVEFLNNAGALQLAKGDPNRALSFLQRAASSALQDGDVRFNYGYALWRTKNLDVAANELKAAVTINPKDGEAQYLLAKTLLALGRKPESDQADQEARRNLSNYAKWEVAPDKIPLLSRLKSDFNRANFYKLSRRPSSVSNLPSPQARLALQSLERAKQLIAEKNDSEALVEIQKALTNDPTLAEAHYLRGRTLTRKNDGEAALGAYSAAIYWNPRLGPAHVALGQIYLGRGDLTRARNHSKLALEIDPQDREATALKRQIEGGR